MLQTSLQDRTEKRILSNMSQHENIYANI